MFWFVVGFGETAKSRKSPISQKDRASIFGPHLVGSISGNADPVVMMPPTRASRVTLPASREYP